MLDPVKKPIGPFSRQGLWRQHYNPVEKRSFGQTNGRGGGFL